MDYLDILYRNTVSKLPVSNRIKYCESLIHRTKDDISNANCAVQKRKLKKLLKAAKIEIFKLNQNN